MPFKPRHVKVRCVVQEVRNDGWTARIFFDNYDVVEAEMNLPLPLGARPGSMFTIHRTKAGREYIYLITKPLWTQRDFKKANVRVRELKKMFADVA